MELNLSPVSSGKVLEIYGKKVNNPKKINEFIEKLEIWEKGQLTDNSLVDTALYQDIIPHKDIPWELYTLCYERSSLVFNAVNNTADFCIEAGFDFEGSKDAKDKILEWMDDTNFELIMRNILIQLQIYGNSYLDISDMKFPKLLPVKTMFVRAQKGGDNDGKILGYTQIIKGGQDKIDFDKDVIIHFKFNDACNPFYGMSEIKPCLGSLTRYANWTDDLGQILHRFASPFIHWTVGTDEIPGTQAQVDATTSFIQNRLPGEDFVTSSAIQHEVVQATQGMMQVDNLVKNLQDEIIAGLRIPEIFARGGTNANKATSDNEMQAFDRKCKALIYVLKMHCEDFLFPKITTRASNIEMVWNEFSAEGELMRAQRLKFMTDAGVPLKTAVQMVGWGTWVDDIETERVKEDERNAEQTKQETALNTQSQVTVANAKPRPNSVVKKVKSSG